MNYNIGFVELGYRHKLVIHNLFTGLIFHRSHLTETDKKIPHNLERFTTNDSSVTPLSRATFQWNTKAPYNRFSVIAKPDKLLIP